MMPKSEQGDDANNDDRKVGAHDHEPAAEKTAPQRLKPRWPWFVTGAVVLGFIGIVLAMIYAPRSHAWTDDAYVMVHYTTIAPRISGQVVSVEVDDDQIVRCGQLLATLDDRDFRTAVEQAEGALARDRASVLSAGVNVTRQPSAIEQAQAQVASDHAKLSFTHADARRYTSLASIGAGSAQQRQSSETSVRQDEASLQGAEAALKGAEQQLEGLKALHESEEGVVRSDEAQLAQARLNLSYTRIAAPLDGMIGERSVQVGNYVSAGAALMSIVPLGQVYIEANYREVDLQHVRPGQHVTIHVDAYNIDLDGIVYGVPPASGTTFAPTQPDNATGNFTKIVQRLPVRIVIAPNQPLAKLLRVGFSVETTIDTGLADVVNAQLNTTAPITAH